MRLAHWQERQRLYGSEDACQLTLTRIALRRGVSRLSTTTGRESWYCGNAILDMERLGPLRCHFPAPGSAVWQEQARSLLDTSSSNGSCSPTTDVWPPALLSPPPKDGAALTIATSFGWQESRRLDGTSLRPAPTTLDAPTSTPLALPLLLCSLASASHQSIFCLLPACSSSGAHTSTVDQSPLQSFSSRYAAVDTYYRN